MQPKSAALRADGATQSDMADDLSQQGVESLLHGDTEEGLAQLSQAMALDESPWRVRGIVASVLSGMGSLPEAAAIVSADALTEPYPEEAISQAIGLYLNMGGTAAASQLATLYHSLSGRTTVAVECAHIAEDVSRRDFDAAQQRLDALSDAVSLAAADDASAASALNTLRQCMQAAILMGRGEMTAARDALEQARDNPHALLMLASIDAAHGDVDAAVDQLALLAAEEDIAMPAARLLLRLDRPKEARELLQSAIQTGGLSDSQEALYLSAQCLEALEGMESAKKQYEALIARCVETQRMQGQASLETSLIRALCCLRIDRYGEAERLLTFLVDLYPDHASLHFLLARALSGARGVGAGEAEMEIGRRLMQGAEEGG